MAAFEVDDFVLFFVFVRYWRCFGLGEEVGEEVEEEIWGEKGGWVAYLAHD